MNPMFAKYRLSCTHPGCGAIRWIEQAFSAGLREGDMVPPDPSDPVFARCQRCQRYKMKVVEGPPQSEPLLPEGFTKIPTE